MRENPSSSQNPQRVFITGMGVISPMGSDFSSHVDSMREGQTHFSPIELFDCSRMRTNTAGVSSVPDLVDFASHPKELKRLDRGGRLLLHATNEALKGAKIDGLAENTLFAIGTSAGSMPVGEEYFQAATAQKPSKRGQFTRMEHYQAQFAVNVMQRILGIRSRTQIISNACASGANAIGHAFQEVRSGRSALALAGGYDALCEMVFAGFGSLQALSESGIPRPFDAERDGLAIGEGAASFVVESEESMRARGATPLAEIRGYGMATDLHHLTQPHPEGDAALSSMSAACKQAKMEPSEIEYINSHGTGTPLNDVAEANAICRWAGDAAKDIMVSSTKSAMGHLLGGAGAVESALCILAMNHQIVPASLNIRTPDPACPV